MRRPAVIHFYVCGRHNAAAGILLSGPRRTGVPGLNLHPREVLAQRARLNWRRRSYGLLLWFLLLFGVLLALSYALPQ